MRSKPHMLAMLGATAALAAGKAGATREPEKQKPVERWCGQHKIGRNEPCPCSSGKKYKKCCGSPLNGCEK